MATDERPYRERVEMFALNPRGQVLGGIYSKDRTFGVFGGGVDPGEDIAEAAARELLEESGYRASNSQVLPLGPFDQDWSPPYKTPQQAERAKHYRGSRTYYATGDIEDDPEREPIEPSNLLDQKFRDLAEARALLEREDLSEKAQARAMSRRSALDMLLSLREKMSSDSMAEGELLGKDESNYREATVAGRNCDTCAYMNQDGTCDIVQGLVQPDMVCDYWKASEKHGSDLIAPTTGDGSHTGGFQLETGPEMREQEEEEEQPGHGMSAPILNPGYKPTKYAYAPGVEGAAPMTGPDDAALAVIGDAPGRIEAREGIPLIGPTGKFVRRELEDQGLDPERVLYGNIYDEAEPQTPELTRQYGDEKLQALDARNALDAILGLSVLAGEGLTGEKAPMKELRQQEYTTPEGKPIQITYHPSAIARTGQTKSRYYPFFREDVARALAHLASKKASVVEDLERARSEVETNPSEKQKEVGNYRKGKLRLHGFDISLENPKGSTRSGTSRNGKPWSVVMQHDYGYIKRTKGKDGDHVDVFLGDHPEAELVFVVNQVDPDTRRFDEHKIILGALTEDEARETYLANYSRDWDGLDSVYALTLPQFKWWLEHGDLTKPVKDGSLAKYRRKASCVRQPQDRSADEGITHSGSGWKTADGSGDPGGEVPAGVLRLRDGLLHGTDVLPAVKRSDERRPSVAVDLDGTLAKELDEFEPDKIGPPRPGAKKWLQLFRDTGARIIVHTCRGDEDVVQAWLNEHDLPYDHINENPDQPPDTSDKLYADAYWDNRSVDASGPLHESAPKVLARLRKAAADFVSGKEKFGIAPRMQQALANQFSYPSIHASSGPIDTLLFNVRQAREKARRRLKGQEATQDILSELDPNYGFQRFHQFAQQGDTLTPDPVDRLLLRGY